MHKVFIIQREKKILNDVPIFVFMDQLYNPFDLNLQSFLKMIRTHLLKGFYYFIKDLLHFGTKQTFENLIIAADLDFNHHTAHQELFFYIKRKARRGRKIIMLSRYGEIFNEEIKIKLSFLEEVRTISNEDYKDPKKLIQQLEETLGARQFDIILNQSMGGIASVRKLALLNGSVEDYINAEERTQLTRVFLPKNRSIRALFKSMRISHWIKNFLIFLPLAFSTEIPSISKIMGLCLLFAAFCLVSSGTYIINDLFDLENDRRHVEKRRRPLAHGSMSITTAIYLSTALLASGILLAALNQSLGFISIYLVTTLLYTLHFKKLSFVDVFVLSALYLLRFLAGADQLAMDIHPWIHGFIWTLFLSLALSKRASELIMRRNLGLLSENFGRGYGIGDIEFTVHSGMLAAWASCFSLALYLIPQVIDPQQQASLADGGTSVYLFIPVLQLYWVSRLWYMTQKGRIGSDPVKFALFDKTSWIIFIICAVLVIAANL